MMAKVNRHAHANIEEGSRVTLSGRIPVGLLQRKCACGQHTVAGGECAECRKKRLSLQRRATNQPEPTTVPPIVHEVLRSPGQPLDPTTRAFMESRFGHDFSQVRPHIAAPQMAKAGLTIGPKNDRFEQEADRVAETVMRTPGLGASNQSALRAGFDLSQVRVHADAKAAESARAVNAVAYTVGQNVTFDAGQWTTETSDGKRLLAHELMHAIQQRSVPVRRQGSRTFLGLYVPGAVPALAHVAETPDAPLARRPIPGSVLRSGVAQLMRTPDDLIEAAIYPTEAEREDILEILDPQQQAAVQAGSSVPSVTDPNGFRQDMTARMNNFIGQVLPRAQARQASSVTLGRTEILDLGDIVQLEVENFYGAYLTAAIHSPAEAQRRAGYRLRSHLHLVSDVQADVDRIACNWVVSRMLYRGANPMQDYHVLASGHTAKESCPPGSPSAASGATNERDQALFESVRDDVFQAHQADLRTIILFQSSFEGGGEAYIQSHIEQRSWEDLQETERRGRWETLGTITHEMLHAVAHEDFDHAAGNIEEVNIAKEGFAEYFARPVYNALRTRATGAGADDALRTSIEGVQAPPDRSLARDLTGYQRYVDQVTEIKRILGGNEESLKVAYFMGRVEYIGLGGWNQREAERREALRYPANQLGVAALLTVDSEGLVRADFGRVIFGRGGAFQITLGGTINYLSDGHRLGLGGTVGLQYSWPNVYVRGRLGVGASVSPDQPFGQSVRLDVMPDVEAGVRIGVVRVGAGATLLIPVTGGPVDERVTRMAAHVGLSLDL